MRALWSADKIALITCLKILDASGAFLTQTCLTVSHGAGEGRASFAYLQRSYLDFESCCLSCLKAKAHEWLPSGILPASTIHEIIALLPQWSAPLPFFTSVMQRAFTIP